MVKDNSDVTKTQNADTVALEVEGFKPGDVVMLGGLPSEIVQFEPLSEKVLVKQTRDGAVNEVRYPMKALAVAKPFVEETETAAPAAPSLDTAEVEMPELKPGERVVTLVQKLGDGDKQQSDTDFEIMLRSGYSVANEQIVYDFESHQVVRVVRFVMPFEDPDRKALHTIYMQTYDALANLHNVLAKKIPGM